jgi:hypothetical protein
LPARRQGIFGKNVASAHLAVQQKPGKFAKNTLKTARCAHPLTEKKNNAKVGSIRA